VERCNGPFGWFPRVSSAFHILKLCSVRVKTLHISSPILAAKSPYFYELFSSETKQSEQRHVTLKINAFVQQLCDAAKLFLVNKFKDIAKYRGAYDLAISWYRSSNF
ncbi:hypothetical protein HN51_016585, partial [Arachis hypogaea]